MEGAEKDCNILGSLFNAIINDLRNSSPVWEDFTYKATKLHQCLKNSLLAVTCFLDAFQRVADMATGSKGATKEMGFGLTRLCMRHRHIENKIKALMSCLLDNMVSPIQEKLEDWKKGVIQLDRDHAKESKRARQDIKKVAGDTLKLQRKVRKGPVHGRGELQARLDCAMQTVTVKYNRLEEVEMSSVRTALIEERSRFCLFVSCIKPFVDAEVMMLSEVSHLEDIMHGLCLQANDPDSLPLSSEQAISDLKGIDPAQLILQVKQHPSPQSSPSSMGSRKSSLCSINSSSTNSSKSHSPGHMTSTCTVQIPSYDRLSKLSSQDSGFVSLDNNGMCSDTSHSLRLHLLQGTVPNADGWRDDESGDVTPTTPFSELVSTPTNSICCPANPPSMTGGCALATSGPVHPVSRTCAKHARLPLSMDLFEPLADQWKQEQPTVSRDAASCGQCGGNGPVKVCLHSSSALTPCHRPAASINKMQPVLPPNCPRPKVKVVAPPSVPKGSSMHVNTNDLHRSSSMDAATMRHVEVGTIRQVDVGTMQHVEVGTMQHVDAWEGGNGAKEMRQNSLELAAAIRELEESTAALQSAYDAPSHTSHTSLHGSSGYGTMNSTPSGSEDTFDAGDCELPSSKVNQSHQCSTIPRSGVANNHAAVKHETQSNRPVSSTGLPDALDAATENFADGVVSPDGRFSNHRSVISIKPPPPVRRTASITGTPASHCLSAHPLQRKMSEVGFYPGRQVPSNGRQYHGTDPAVCRHPAKPHGRQAPLLNPKPACFDQVRRDGDLSLSVGISANGTSSTSPLPLADGGHYAEPSVVSVTSRWPYAMEQGEAAKPAFPAPHYQNVASVSSTTYVGGKPTGSGVEKDARLMPPPPPTGVMGVCLAGKMAVMDPAFFPKSHHLLARALRCEQLPSSVHAPASMDCVEDDFPLPPSAEELAEMGTLYCGSSVLVTDSPKQEQLMVDLKSHILANCPKM